jgi:hypothetical protein
MIKFTAKSGKDGHQLVGLGITSANLGAMAEGKPLFVKGEEMGLPIDIVVFYGRTEEDLKKVLEPLIGPETKIKDFTEEKP